jgi:hypothetical protein
VVLINSRTNRAGISAAIGGQHRWQSLLAYSDQCFFPEFPFEFPFIMGIGDIGFMGIGDIGSMGIFLADTGEDFLAINLRPS